MNRTWFVLIAVSEHWPQFFTHDHLATVELMGQRSLDPLCSVLQLLVCRVGQAIAQTHQNVVAHKRADSVGQRSLALA